jgi:signal peptidase I
MIPVVAAMSRVSNGAMSPTVEIGDTIAVNHIAYLLLNPKRGDIVQFLKEDSGQDEMYLRRVIGLPGETVQIMDGSVYINGRQIQEPYASGLIQYAGTAGSQLTLTDDEYFVLADNRSNNFDSRDPTVGTISRDDIRGKVWLRILPFEKFGILK